MLINSISGKYIALRVLRDELLKVLLGRRDVQLRQCCRNLGTWTDHNDHDVGVAGEHVDVGSKVRISHFHPTELRL